MKILVAIHSEVPSWNIPAPHVERLRAAFPHHEFVHVTDEAGIGSAVRDAEVVFTSAMRPVHFTGAGRLRWIHSPAAGIGGMLFPELRDSGVILTNSRGMSADTIAEHVLALTFALFRKLPMAAGAQSRREWAQDTIWDEPFPRTIEGAHVSIVGLGGIGAACAAKYAALGASVVGVRRRPDAPLPAGVTRVVGHAELLPALRDADVVVLAAPQTQATHGLIGREALDAMNARTILINVSRGKLVDEAALAEALRQGRIAGAGLDVFAQEPLDPASPLWGLENVIITPHVAAARADHWNAATALFAENLRRFDRGEPLLNVVDKHAGY